MDKRAVLNFLGKHDFRIGALLFVLVVFFTHAPFFLYIPVPGVSMDSFNYYWFAMEIYNGKLPVIDQPHDFPWGYPLFLYGVKVLGGNILHVAYAQTLIFVFAGTFMIRQFGKSLDYGGLIAAIALVVFVIQPLTIKHNITLYMESLYTSGLFILAGSIAAFFRRKDKIAFLMVILGVLWVMLIRPNGVAMLIAPFMLIGYSFLNNINYKPFLLALFGLVVFNVVGNYYFKGRISFGDSKRIERVIAKAKGRYDTIAKYKNDVPPNSQSNTIKQMISKYFFNVVEAKPSFYYSLQTTNYNMFITQEMPQKTDLQMFDGRALVDTFAPGLRDFMFSSYPLSKYQDSQYKEQINYESKNKNKWIFFVHLTYQLFYKIKIAYIVYFGFWAVFFISFYRVFISSEACDLHRLIVLLSAMHIVSLILLPFIHNRFQLRYIHVSEFIVYLVCFAGIAWLFSKKNSGETLTLKNQFVKS